MHLPEFVFFDAACSKTLNTCRDAEISVLSFIFRRRVSRRSTDPSLGVEEEESVEGVLGTSSDIKDNELRGSPPLLIVSGLLGLSWYRDLGW